MSQPPKDIMLANARALRRNMTPWERKLWYLFLRNYPVKIYRQHILGPYIAESYNKIFHTIGFYFFLTKQIPKHTAFCLTSNVERLTVLSH